MVKTALESANKSRLVCSLHNYLCIDHLLMMFLAKLARRLYYSFTKPGAEFMLIDDIARFFHSHEEAEQAFNLFDKDSNGDASRDEVEMACMCASFNKLCRTRLTLVMQGLPPRAAVHRTLYAGSRQCCWTSGQYLHVVVCGNRGAHYRSCIGM